MKRRSGVTNGTATSSRSQRKRARRGKDGCSDMDKKVTPAEAAQGIVRECECKSCNEDLGVGNRCN